MARLRQVRGQGGFTLVEVLIAMVVILIAVLGMVVLLDRASAGSSESKVRAQGTNIVRHLLETAQGLSYTSITTTAQLQSAMQSNGFPDWDPSTTTTWDLCSSAVGSVKSGSTACSGTVFTVTANECSVDDTHDGSGPHPASSNFCADSPSGNTDSNAEDYKRMSFTVTPATAGLGPGVTETTVVGSNRASNPGGSGSGSGSSSITVSSLKITSPTLVNGQIAPCTNNFACTWKQTTTSTVTPASVTFQAITASTAQKVRFSVDGQVMATVNGPGTTFNWTWTLPAAQPDGTYNITAQVFDSAGSTPLSDPKPLSAILNRYLPDFNAYTVAAAGRNPLYGFKPEIETYPTTGGTGRVDRDVTGFLVARFACTSGCTGVQVGTTASGNVRWMQDNGAPTCAALPCTGILTYQITPVGLYPDGSQQLGNPTPKSVNVNLANNRPCAPTNVQAVRAGNIVTFTWTNPGTATPGCAAAGATSGDPDSGDCVDFFRVYSKSASDASAFQYTERADRTPFGNATSPCGANSTEQSNGIMLWENDSTPKRYQVTAVDTKLAESLPATPANCGSSC